MCPGQFYEDQEIDFDTAAEMAGAFNHTMTDAFHEWLGSGEVITSTTDALIDELNMAEAIQSFLDSDRARNTANNIMDDAGALTGADVEGAKDMLANTESAGQVAGIVQQLLEAADQQL